VPLDATAVGRTLAQGAAKANAQAKAAGEHEHKATEIWTRTASGMGHQGATRSEEHTSELQSHA